MEDGRKEISLEQVAEAKKKGFDFILEDLEVVAKVTVKDKDGNVKGTFNMRNNDATRNNCT